MSICKVLFVLIRGLFVSRSDLTLENLALRQQLTVQQRTVKRPKLKSKDRVLWTWLSRIWPEWKSALIIVKPETVIKWNRQGFKFYWRWKSRTNKVGRPRIPKKIRDLIRQMSHENPTFLLKFRTRYSKEGLELRPFYSQRLTDNRLSTRITSSTLSLKNLRKLASCN